MEQNLVLHLCTLCAYCVFYLCFTGVVNKEISQGKLFILSGKVRENEFCKVVGTLVFQPTRPSAVCEMVLTIVCGLKACFKILLGCLSTSQLPVTFTDLLLFFLSGNELVR